MLKKKSKKAEVNEDLSKNNGKNIRYRKRIQEDVERELELKEYFDKGEYAGTTIQDPIRRDNLSE